MKMDTPLCFVVIEDNPIIAEDIAESIRDYVACAAVVVWNRAEASVEALRTLPGLCAAFCSIRAAEVISSGLHKAVEMRGGVLVSTYGEEDDALAAPGNWIELKRPFTADQIHLVLQNLGVARTEPAR